MKNIKWSAILFAFLSGLGVVIVGTILVSILGVLLSVSFVGLLAWLPFLIAFFLLIVGLDVFMGYVCARLSSPYGLWNSFILGCVLTGIGLFGGIHSFMEFLRLCLTIPFCMTGAILYQRYHR